MVAVIHPPRPLLLLLEPNMVTWPWSTAVAGAAMSVQQFAITHHPDRASLADALALAVDQHAIEAVVLCGEGTTSGPRGPGSAIESSALELHAWLGADASPALRRLRIEAIWFDLTTRRLHALRFDPDKGELTPYDETGGLLIRLFGEGALQRAS